MTYRKHNVSCEESLEQLLAEEKLDIPDPQGQPDPLDTAISHDQWDRPRSYSQPERCRQILEMRRKGYTYEEIANPWA